jgi:hypothetical protein
MLDEVVTGIDERGVLLMGGRGGPIGMARGFRSMRRAGSHGRIKELRGR